MSKDNNTELAHLVEETIRNLYEKGIAASDLAPLVKLHDAVKGMASKPPVAEPVPAPRIVEPAAPQPLELASSTTVPMQGAAGPDIPEISLSVDGQEPHGPYDRDGRRGVLKASEELMARASAVIDLLIQSGQSPEHAAQTITRQLLSVGIQLPECGGDVRAWKRLLNWRNNLIHYKRAGHAWDVYCAFKEGLADIPPDKRIQVAVGERLWDQRKMEFSSAIIA